MVNPDRRRPTNEGRTGTEFPGRRTAAGRRKSQRCHKQFLQFCAFALERPQFLVSFPRHHLTSLRLCSVFTCLRWFKLAHVSIQLTTLHNGASRETISTLLIGNRFHVKITHPQSWHSDPQPRGGHSAAIPSQIGFVHSNFVVLRRCFIKICNKIRNPDPIKCILTPNT